MNILIVCTSAKDRSPALVNYLEGSYPVNQQPRHYVRAAGINKYFCDKHDTHYLTQQDVHWADIIFFVEQIQLDVFAKKYKVQRQFTNVDCEDYYIKPNGEIAKLVVLRLGEFKVGTPEAEDYLVKADLIISKYLNT